MRAIRLFMVGVVLAASGCVSMPLSPAEAVSASLAPPSRPELSLNRVPGKPPVALNLAAFGPYGEGGLFDGGEVNEVISQINGPPPALKLEKHVRPEEQAEARSADARIGSVHYQSSLGSAATLGADSLDGALMMTPYGKPREWGSDRRELADDPGKYIEQIVTALKPGAVLLVVDRPAGPGAAGKGAAKAPLGQKPLGADDLKAHGLEFIGSIPATSHPRDAAQENATDPAAAAETGREWVFDLYRKPDPDRGAAEPP